jgi:HSP20 family protein
MKNRPLEASREEARTPGWDDFFDDEDFFSPFSLIRRETDLFRPSETFIPRVDVQELDHEMKVTAELPGLDEKEVKVELEDNSLVISGEKKEERQEKTKSGIRTERRFGSFHRSIPLPARGDVEKARAEFRKGVLTVTIPKTEEPRKHIEIKID